MLKAIEFEVRGNCDQPETDGAIYQVFDRNKLAGQTSRIGANAWIAQTPEKQAIGGLYTDHLKAIDAIGKNYAALNSIGNNSDAERLQLEEGV